MVNPNDMLSAGSLETGRRRSAPVRHAEPSFERVVTRENVGFLSKKCAFCIELTNIKQALFGYENGIYSNSGGLIYSWSRAGAAKLADDALTVRM
jgi:hypothetical protein